MKNFEYTQEQKLIRDIWNIHDEIFSMPSKQFFINFKNTTGYPIKGYEHLKENNHINLNIIYDNVIPQLKFGDILITLKIQKFEKCETNIEYKKNNNYIDIIVTTDFLHYRQCILTLGDCVEHYIYKKHNQIPQITQLVSFEKQLLNKLKEKNHERN